MQCCCTRVRKRPDLDVNLAFESKTLISGPFGLSWSRLVIENMFLDLGLSPSQSLVLSGLEHNNTAYMLPGPNGPENAKNICRF